MRDAVEKAYKEGKKIQFQNPRCGYGIEIPATDRLWGFYRTLDNAQIALKVAQGFDERYEIVGYQEVQK